MFSPCHCSGSVTLWKHNGDKHNCETSLFVCGARCCLSRTSVWCPYAAYYTTFFFIRKKSLLVFLRVNTHAAVGLLSHSFLLLVSKRFIFLTRIKESDHHHHYCLIVISTKLWKQLDLYQKQVKMTSLHCSCYFTLVLSTQVFQSLIIL